MESIFIRRSTLIFLTIILIVVGIVATLVLVQERQEPRIPAAVSTSLELISSADIINQGDEVMVDVMLRPAEASIKRAEITLNFDKSIFTGISFTPTGSTFNNVILPGIVGNDSANIVLETDPAVAATSDGVVARLSLKARNPGTSAVTVGQQTKIYSVDGSVVTATFTNSSITVNRTINPDSILYFSPSSVNNSPNEEFDVDVYINTGSNQISSGVIIIPFDPSILEAVRLQNHEFLPDLEKEKLAIVVTSSSLANGKVVFNFLINIGMGELKGIVKLNQITFKTKIAGNTSLTFSSQSLVLDPRSDENMLKDQGALVVNSGIGGTSLTRPSPTPNTGEGICKDTAPLAPTDVWAQALSKSQIKLSWNNSDLASHYGIVYGTDPTIYKFGAANIGNTTSYVVENLSPGTTYYFAVFAVHNCAASGYSSQVSATTLNKDSTFKPIVYPSPTGYTEADFIPLDETEDPIEFLMAGKPSPLSSLVLLPSPTPAGFSFDQLTSNENPLLSPLGGILLIIAAIFVGVFFFRMRQ